MSRPPTSDATGRRAAFLPAAIVGNGSLLVTLSARGEVERLFWPRVDGGQHLAELRLGIALDGPTLWLDEEPFAWEQAYETDASILRTIARGAGGGVEIADLDAVDEPVLLRRVRSALDGRLVVYCRADIEERRFGGAAYVDPETGALVFYRGSVARRPGCRARASTSGSSMRGSTRTPPPLSAAVFVRRRRWQRATAATRRATSPAPSESRPESRPTSGARSGARTCARDSLAAATRTPSLSRRSSYPASRIRTGPYAASTRSTSSSTRRSSASPGHSAP